jgi:hypothetical protein
MTPSSTSADDVLSMTAAARNGERRRRSSKAAAAAVVVALAGVPISACGGADSSSSERAGTASANPHYGAPGAKLELVSPRRRASLRAPVRVEVRVSGFRLDGKDLGKAPKRGFGHLHFRMDGGKYDRARYSGTGGALAARLGVAGRYSVATSPAITYERLPVGRHTLVVTLANNDLSETGVRARTVVTVSRSARHSAQR